MKQITITFVLSALLCSSSFAEDARPAKDKDASLSDESLSKLLDQAGELKAAVDRGDATREQAIARLRGQLQKLAGDEAVPKSDRKDYRDRYRMEVKDPAEFSASQDKPLYSGPQPGERLPPFKATGIGGELDGKEFDAIALAQGRPHILIFQENSGVAIRGLFGFRRRLASITSKSKQGPYASAIFLDDDWTTASRSLKKNAGDDQDDFLVGISKDGRDGPGAYGLNRDMAMTILIAKDGKVLYNFPFPQGMLYPDPHVLGAIAEVIGEERATVQEWLNEEQPGGERMRMRARTKE